jgi:hypothetical protein
VLLCVDVREREREIRWELKVKRLEDKIKINGVAEVHRKMQIN